MPQNMAFPRCSYAFQTIASTADQIHCFSGVRPMSASADRNLLFGILALQMDFISRDQLVAGMNAWVLQKGTPLSYILVGQGSLSAMRRDMIESLVVEHIRQHDDDPAKSLSAVSSIEWFVREMLKRV